MSDLYLAFEAFLRQEQAVGLAPARTVYYERCWSLFRLIVTSEQSSRGDMSGFLVTLAERGQKPVTRQTWYRGHRVFFRWARDAAD